MCFERKTFGKVRALITNSFWHCFKYCIVFIVFCVFIFICSCKFYIFFPMSWFSDKICRAKVKEDIKTYIYVVINLNEQWWWVFYYSTIYAWNHLFCSNYCHTMRDHFTLKWSNRNHVIPNFIIKKIVFWQTFYPCGILICHLSVIRWMCVKNCQHDPQN